MEARVLESRMPEGVKLEIIEPSAARNIFPSLTADTWVYRYTESKEGWVLSIATLGKPGSGSYSLGGFRIAPLARVMSPNYNNDAEALGLATGMEEKVYWSRLLKVAGPLAISELQRVVGGKCVLKPTPGSRIGEPKDFALLRFATACLNHMEAVSHVRLTTGQDLGHGIMSDGKTASLTFLHDNFAGSITADTSLPTAEGNFQMILGALKGLGIAPKVARVGLIGVGNIGLHLLNSLTKVGVTCLAIESNPTRCADLRARGIEVWAPADKEAFLAQPMSIVACNANGSTLDTATVKAICANPAIQFICGCENLVMPVASDATLFEQAHKVYCPTELCGMMGYLTAVEQYLSNRQGKKFIVDVMIPPATRLAEAGERGVKEVRAEGYRINFEAALRKLFA